MGPGEEPGIVRKENEAARDIYSAQRDINITNYCDVAPRRQAIKQVVTGEIPRQPLGFMARDAQAELAQAAAQADVAVVCAVTGLRGVGKTQLAAAYARDRVRGGCGLIAWVNAETGDTLLAGLARAAEGAGVADPQGDSLESARRLKEHLQTRPDESLLVFDNATDPDQLRPFLPATGKTQVIVTTTDRAFTEIGEAVEVPVFSRLEALTYLAQRTGLADLAGATAVAEELGDLPLGLAQAAATIRRQRLTYARYLDRLHRVPAQTLLGRPPGADYPHSAAAALLLSIDSTERTDPTGLASRVLRVVAALSPNGVHRDIVTGLAAPDAADREEALDAAVERCTTGSLLTWSINGDSVIMHRLLGRVLRERDQAGGRWHETVAVALDLLEPRLVPAGHAWARRDEGEHLAEQFEALWEADVTAGSTAPDLRLRILQGRVWAVSQLRDAANLTGAVARGVQVLGDCTAVLGADHPETLRAKNALAVAYRSAGRLSEAIALYEETLTSRSRVLGDDHPDTLESRNNLAFAYRVASRIDEAIALYERTLADRQRILGDDHPKTLLSKHNLAGGIQAAGRLDEAIALYRQALADRQRVLGPDDPATLNTRNTLAGAYQQAGQLHKALVLYEQTLAARERVLGVDHPQVLRSRNDLAGAYRSVGRLHEAFALYERTLADRARVLGPDNPQVLRSRHDLASAYQAAGRFQEALALYERTLADRERVLGTEHPATLNTRKALADARQAAALPD